MITPDSDVLHYLGADVSTPVWYLEITKSEGTTDPDSGSDPWPGSGTAETVRIFTTGAPPANATWTSYLATGIAFADRLDIGAISTVAMALPSADLEPGGIAGLDSFTVTLDNTDGGIYGRSVDTEFVGVNFKGRTAELKLTFSDVAIAPADSMTVFTGRVSDVQPKGDRLVLSIESQQVGYELEIPKRIFSEERDSEIYDARAAETPVPIVFGAHDMATGVGTKFASDTGAADAGRTVQFCDVTDLTEMKAINEVRFGDSGLIESSGGFAQIATTAGPGLTASEKTEYTTDVAEGTIVFDEPDEDEYHFWMDIRPTGMIVHGSNHVSDTANGIDGDTATYVDLTISGSPPILKVMGYRLPAIGIDGNIGENGNAKGIYFLSNWGWDHDDANDRSTTIIAIGNGDTQTSESYTARPGVTLQSGISSGSAGYYTTGIASTAIQYSMSGGNWDTDFEPLGVFGTRYLKAQIWRNSGTSVASFFYAYEFRLRIYFAMTELDNAGWYADCEGLEDDGSGNITGGANALVEGPADILAYLYAKLTDAGTAGVNLTETQAITAGERSSWIFAHSLTEKRKLRAYAEDLAREAMLWVWFDNEGTVRVTPWETASSAIQISKEDLTNGELISAKLTRIEEVVTDFIFRYKHNPVRDEFDKSLFCNAADSSTAIGSEYESLCEWAAYDNGDYSNKETYDFEWIRDDDTMAAAAKRLITYHTSQRWLVEFEADLKLATLQVGDLIALADVEFWPIHYPSEVVSGEFRITGVRIQPAKSRVRVKAAQVF